VVELRQIGVSKCRDEDVVVLPVPSSTRERLAQSAGCPLAQKLNLWTKRPPGETASTSSNSAAARAPGAERKENVFFMRGGPT
jgi:hypothetical protein